MFVLTIQLSYGFTVGLATAIVVGFGLRVYNYGENLAAFVVLISMFG